MSMRDYYLTQLGISNWQLQPAQSPVAVDLRTLAERVSVCTRCDLCSSRTQTVFGRGALQPKIVIVGEAPGFHEDQQGQPFVGRAGQLLDAILSALEFSMDDIYIANILKCRPPSNRDPTAIEVQHCTPYLVEQIQLLAPQLIVALGRHAAHYLLNTDASLAKLRRTVGQFGPNNTPVLVSYHPAYLLRNPTDKRAAYHDWQQIRSRLQVS